MRGVLAVVKYSTLPLHFTASLLLNLRHAFQSQIAVPGQAVKFTRASAKRYVLAIRHISQQGPPRDGAYTFTLAQECGWV